MSACRIPKEELYVHPAFDLKWSAQDVLGIVPQSLVGRCVRAIHGES